MSYFSLHSSCSTQHLRLHSTPVIFFCFGHKIPYSFIMEGKFHIPSRTYILSYEAYEAFHLSKYGAFSKIPGECNFLHLTTLIIY